PRSILCPSRVDVHGTLAASTDAVQQDRNCRQLGHLCRRAPRRRSALVFSAAPIRFIGCSDRSDGVAVATWPEAHCGCAPRFGDIVTSELLSRFLTNNSAR